MNHRVVSVMSFNYSHIECECRISVFAMKTQITNSFNRLNLFGTPPPLSSISTHIFWARPLKIVHGFFFSTFLPHFLSYGAPPTRGTSPPRVGGVP